jgi:farnesyl-diphosphate farnesyltransferase
VNARDLERLRGPILRSVSRSFYLSLRILPQPLRDPLSLAYLLARATDTIADTPEPPAELRIEALQDLAWAIQGTGPREAASSIRDSFASLQSNEAERALIEALPAALEWLESLGERDRCEVREVLEKITRGQMLDLERFGASPSTSPSIKALQTPGDLDEYTYLVAGCVGEFWTRVCFAHVRNFCDRHEPAMLALGVQYGKALQLINILRDAGSDLREGRCYLPAEELDLLGLAPDQVLNNAGRAEPVLQRWRDKAGRELAAGLEYACAIRSWRVRLATALPALIGARTLSLLRAAGAEVFTHKVKVTRAEVREIVLSTTLRLASPHSLRETFHRLS